MAEPRPAAQLAATDDPAWPQVQTWALGAGATILPVSAEAGLRTLYRLQVSARSTLGALALNCGGIVLQSGWLRLLGGGHDGLLDLATANGLADPSGHDHLPAELAVAHDVVGGLFAVNGGELPGQVGEVAYWGPDTLDWTPLGVGHSGFVEWALSDVAVGFYEELRWDGWEDEAAALGLDEGIALDPAPFTPE